MKRICPNPMSWSEVFERLTKYAKSYPCTPSVPPKPLILAGWAFSNDIEKMQRWEETIEWASKNGCADLISDISDKDFYFVETPTSYIVSPLGGPMHRSWDFEIKKHPSSDLIALAMHTLLSRWSEIVGIELAGNTRPLAFTGDKARRLLVLANATATPPWGTWWQLSTKESKRRTFTLLRAEINKAISPHEVDHIDFTTEDRIE